MDRKTEENLFELFRFLYSKRKEVTLDSGWRDALMGQVMGKASQLSESSQRLSLVPAPLTVGMAMTLLLAFIALIITQLQFNSEILSLAFEMEHEFINI